MWEHLEGSVKLFRVAEWFSYDFETILHIADKVRLVNGAHTYECVSVSGYIVCMAFHLMTLQLGLAWMHVLHFVVSFTYPSMRDHRAV